MFWVLKTRSVRGKVADIQDEHDDLFCMTEARLDQAGDNLSHLCAPEVSGGGSQDPGGGGR